MHRTPQRKVKSAAAAAYAFTISALGSARASRAHFRRLAEMLPLFNQKKVVGEAPTTAREGAPAPQKKLREVTQCAALLLD
jgi:hypothetical protein